MKECTLVALVVLSGLLASQSANDLVKRARNSDHFVTQESLLSRVVLKHRQRADARLDNRDDHRAPIDPSRRRHHPWRRGHHLSRLSFPRDAGTVR